MFLSGELFSSGKPVVREIELSVAGTLARDSIAVKRLKPAHIVDTF
jgi:hypothetical protein